MSTKTPQPKIDEIFNQLLTETMDELKKLNSTVKTLKKEFDGKNWGYVGTLGHVLDNLKNLNQL